MCEALGLFDSGETDATGTPRALGRLRTHSGSFLPAVPGRTYYAARGEASAQARGGGGRGQARGLGEEGDWAVGTPAPCREPPRGLCVGDSLNLKCPEDTATKVGDSRRLVPK